MIPEDLAYVLKKYKYEIFIYIVLLTAGFVSIIFFGKDNTVENKIEQIIEKKIGFDIDFSRLVKTLS